MGMCGDAVSATIFDALMHPLEVLALRRRRRHLVGLARGRVLEIGSGSGANLRHYRWRNIEQITLIDPEIPPQVRDFPFPVSAQLEALSAEMLPFADRSFDTIVFTLVFCTIVDPRAAMAELFRVLSAGGRVLFIEHVLPPSKRLQAPMRAINPIWRRFSNGCNLVRQTGEELVRAGFVIEQQERFARGVVIAGIARRP